MKPHQVTRLGVGYVPEERRIFPILTVQQNLLLGKKSGKLQNQIKEGWTIERAYALFPQLKARQASKGGHLSGGEQQMLTIVRTLMGNPELLLLDEPTEGLAPMLVDTVSDVIRESMKPVSPSSWLSRALRVSTGFDHKSLCHEQRSDRV